MAIQIYGREFATNSRLDVELYCFRMGLTIEQGGLGKVGHFKNIVNAIWPYDPIRKSGFMWYSWAEEQAEALCNYSVTGFTAGANCSKSDMMGKYGLVNWFADPSNTLVIFCSTSVKDAKGKIWAHVVRDFREARAKRCAVGNLVESMAIIRLSEKTDGVAAADDSAVCLIAAGDEFKDDSLKRLQGMKSKGKIVLCLDELQDCSSSIIESAIWNLSANPEFEVHAVGNAGNLFDPHGVMLAPVEGWNTVNSTTHRWKIKVGLKEGVAIHFDGTAPDSPNMLRFAQGEPQLPFLRRAEDSLAAKIHFGETNGTYLRQFVGFWNKSAGETDFVYTDASISASRGEERPIWKTAPNDFVGIDPAYSPGGDRFVFSHLKYGLSEHDIWTIEFYEDILIRPILAKNETKDYAAMRECKRICEERGIHPRNVGMDASAGTALLSIMHQHWSAEILGVQFGGKPTDLQVSQFDKRIASDLYYNAVSELWYVGVEFLNADQIRGLKPDRIKELVARKFGYAAGGKIEVEPKKEMKKRIGFSPDVADAGFIGLHVIRDRLKVVAGKSEKTTSQSNGDWKKLARKFDVVTQSEHARGPGWKRLFTGSNF